VSKTKMVDRLLNVNYPLVMLINIALQFQSYENYQMSFLQAAWQRKFYCEIGYTS